MQFLYNAEIMQCQKYIRLDFLKCYYKELEDFPDAWLLLQKRWTLLR